MHTTVSQHIEALEQTHSISIGANFYTISQKYKIVTPSAYYSSCSNSFPALITPYPQESAIEFSCVTTQQISK